jgi:hypothetical protein
MSVVLVPQIFPAKAKAATTILKPLAYSGILYMLEAWEASFGQSSLPVNFIC